MKFVIKKAQEGRENVRAAAAGAAAPPPPDAAPSFFMPPAAPALPPDAAEKLCVELAAAATPCVPTGAAEPHSANELELPNPKGTPATGCGIGACFECDSKETGHGDGVLARGTGVAKSAIQPPAAAPVAAPPAMPPKLPNPKKLLLPAPAPAPTLELKPLVPGSAATAVAAAASCNELASDHDPPNPV